MLWLCKVVLWQGDLVFVVGFQSCFVPSGEISGGHELHSRPGERDDS